MHYFLLKSEFSEKSFLDLPENLQNRRIHCNVTFQFLIILHFSCQMTTDLSAILKKIRIEIDVLLHFLEVSNVHNSTRSNLAYIAV